MLPFIARNRRQQTRDEIANSNMNQILSKYRGYVKTTKFWQIPLKLKCIFVCLLTLSVFCYGSLYLSWKENHLTRETFLETDKCPMCYGRSMCFGLFDNQYEMTGYSKFRALDFVNVKNVHFAKHKIKESSVMLKKLGHNSEIQAVDDRICEDSDRPPGCDVSRRAVLSNIVQDIHTQGLQPAHLKGRSFMFQCPSHRLIEDLSNRYLENTARLDNGQLVLDDRIQILFTASVNPEPLLLQMFPKSEGWPFPEYYGACGRYIVVENCGKSLSEFYNAPWEKRADLAFQIIQIAQKLYSHEDYILYWTDLDYENLAVDPGGKVSVIDLEDFVVVDRELVKKINPKGHEDFHESRFDKCEGESTKNCLTFSSEKLCSHSLSDHNYYVACRNLLSQFADEREMGRPGGLLHHMPSYAKDDWDLENLLNECANPSQPQGRVKVVQRLLAALDALRQFDFDKSVKPGKRIT